MVDPDDFVDKDVPEGEEEGNPRAGQEGVGGLTTEEAEEAYTNAANQHFDNPPQDDQQSDENDISDTITDKEQKEDENVKTPPQIGSIEDNDEISVD